MTDLICDKVFSYLENSFELYCDEKLASHTLLYDDVLVEEMGIMKFIRISSFNEWFSEFFGCTATSYFDIEAAVKKDIETWQEEYSFGKTDPEWMTRFKIGKIKSKDTKKWFISYCWDDAVLFGCGWENFHEPEDAAEFKATRTRQQGKRATRLIVQIFVSLWERSFCH